MCGGKPKAGHNRGRATATSLLWGGSKVCTIVKSEAYCVFRSAHRYLASATPRSFLLVFVFAAVAQAFLVGHR